MHPKMILETFKPDFPRRTVRNGRLVQAQLTSVICRTVRNLLNGSIRHCEACVVEMVDSKVKAVMFPTFVPFISRADATFAHTLSLKVSSKIIIFRLRRESERARGGLPGMIIATNDASPTTSFRTPTIHPAKALRNERHILGHLLMVTGFRNGEPP